ncbi:MAG: PP2C family protein-serine/threonine phosphatase [Gammaproteobacteria bacterium]
MNAIEFAAGTHLGLVRELNEDSLLEAPELGLWIVADGMGGHEAGDVASRITVTEIAQGMKNGSSLTEAIVMAHREIQTAAVREGGSCDMGSTVVAAKLEGRHYEIAWVGDSRAYLWNGVLRQLSTDHSYVQMLFEAGVITRAEMADHPARNIISQGLGVGGVDTGDVEVDLVCGDLAENDVLLLCSDGLTGEISDDRLEVILADSTDLHACVDRLIGAALEAGGKDNVTVVLLKLRS